MIGNQGNFRHTYYVDYLYNLTIFQLIFIPVTMLPKVSQCLVKLHQELHLYLSLSFLYIVYIYVLFMYILYRHIESRDTNCLFVLNHLRVSVSHKNRRQVCLLSSIIKIMNLYRTEKSQAGLHLVHCKTFRSPKLRDHQPWHKSTVYSGSSFHVNLKSLGMIMEFVLLAVL